MAFTFVLFEGFHVAFGYIGETTVERYQCLRIERRAVKVGRVIEVFQQLQREVGLLQRQIFDEIVRGFFGSHG